MSYAKIVTAYGDVYANEFGESQRVVGEENARKEIAIYGLIYAESQVRQMQAK